MYILYKISADIYNIVNLSQYMIITLRFTGNVLRSISRHIQVNKYRNCYLQVMYNVVYLGIFRLTNKGTAICYKPTPFARSAGYREVSFTIFNHSLSHPSSNSTFRSLYSCFNLCIPPSILLFLISSFHSFHSSFLPFIPSIPSFYSSFHSSFHP